jgi:hypothetical protein
LRKMWMEQMLNLNLMIAGEFYADMKTVDMFMDAYFEDRTSCYMVKGTIPFVIKHYLCDIKEDLEKLKKVQKNII